MFFKGRDLGGKSPALVKTKTLTVSLLTLAIHAVVNPALAAENSSEQDIVVYGGTDNAADEQQDYAVKTTRAGTKMLLAPRDVPQSVSVVTQQRMKDQDLQNIDAVLTNATGVSSQQIDSERSNYFSRGFEITNFFV